MRLSLSRRLLGLLAACVAPAAFADPGQALTFEQLRQDLPQLPSGEGTSASITLTRSGARLDAVMQDLEAESTREGLWLTSVADEDGRKPNRFRVRAMEVGRGEPTANSQRPAVLDTTGEVRLLDEAVAYIRPGLIEEYRVSSDGVRQDFIVMERPAGLGATLEVGLEITGARAETAAYGAKLTVAATGRELAYSRLMVTDATGRELTAHLMVEAADRLRVEVVDAGAVYPVRIDPTFSDADWVGMSGIAGASGTVYALAVDGSGNLYIGGDFDTVGSQAISNAAKWDGSNWSSMGTGGMNGIVRALAVSGTDVYAGGEFTTAGGVSASRIAKWNGSAWSALGSGVNNTVNAIAFIGTNLYATGTFTVAGASSASQLAKWDGATWAEVGGGLDGTGHALAVMGTDLYVGGAFTGLGSQGAANIAKWDGTSFTRLGPSANPGLNNTCRALTVLNSNLYAGGKFSTAGGVTVSQIARWNGTAWSALGTGMNDATEVYALAVSNTNVYAGGQFTSAGGVTASHIARWNGTVWIALGAGVNNDVHSIVFSNNTVYAGGTFDAAGTVGAQCLARFDNATSTWSSMASGASGQVRATAVLGTDIYVGGSFLVMGGVAAKYVARWNGSTWSALGTGLDGEVTSMAASSTRLYVSGNFLNAGGLAATRIASWNGSAWSAMGSLGSNGAHALVASGASGLWAGGGFSTAGGLTAVSQVAFWNGSSWSTLPTGIFGGEVRALAVVGSSLYIGGDFTPGNFVRWTGSSFDPINGVSGTIYSMVTTGTSVYLGGSFVAGGATNVAQYTGTGWGPVGTGTNGSVRSLQVSGTTLYAGGDFTTAGGVAAERIARWNGTTWAALGSGLDGRCSGIAVLNGTAHVVGDFTRAGGQIAGGVARADVSGLPATTLTNPTLLTTTGVTLNGTVSPHGEVTTAQFQYGTTTSYGTNLPVTLSPNNGSGSQAVSTPVSGLTPGTLYHYRLSATSPVGTFNSSDGTFTTISNNANLANLVPSAGTLSPAFSSAVVSYTASVSTTVPSITVTPTTSHANATVKVNDATVTSGSASPAIPLQVGDNVITIVVTAQDGTTTKTYTLTVTRLSDDPSLSSLVLSSGALSPVFSSGTTSYTSTVGAGSITVTPTATDAGATIKINNVTVASGAASSPIVLALGVNNISVVVTAQNGLVTRTYSLAVTGQFPRIRVETGGVVLADGNSSVGFGDAAIGFFNEVTFTIKNTGTANLDNFVITKDGPDEARFSVTAAPTSPVAGPSGSTTFTVRFTPVALGLRTAALHIASNDPHTPSFDFTMAADAHAPVVGAISIEPPPFGVIVVDEGAGVVSIPIIRTGGMDGPVGFTITAANGNAIVNSDFTAPTPALRSIGHGVGLMTVDIPILLNTASEPNETFTVTISNPSGGATLGALKTVTVRIIDDVDIKDPPAPSVTYPAANALVNVAPGDPLELSGKATDDKGVAYVEVQFNDSGTWEMAEVNPPGTVSGTWKYTVTPIGGANTVKVRTTDTRLRVGPEATHIFRTTRPLLVTVDPTMGSVTAGFAGSTAREPGKAYTITATAKTTPAPGFVFSSWSYGGVGSPEEIGLTIEALEVPTITFIHREGLELMPNFVENPFGPVAGIYRGLIVSDSPGVDADGSIIVTVAATGAFSAKILLDGQTLNIAGLFDPTGLARFGTKRDKTLSVFRTGKPSIFIAFGLDFSGEDIIQGGVQQVYRNVLTKFSEVYAERAHFNGTTVPVYPDFLGFGGATAVYNSVMDLAETQPVELDADYFPGGSGIATMTVSKAGVVTFAGLLSDGTAVTASSTVSQYMTCPIFCQLYGLKGYFGGLLAFNVYEPETDVQSIGMRWARPFMNTHHFQFGWPETLNLELFGSRYFVFAGESVLFTPVEEGLGGQLPEPSPDRPEGNASLQFPNMFINEMIYKTLNITVADGVLKIPPTDASFSLAINRATGRFSGYFTNPDDNTKPVYQGTFIQKGPRTGGYGYFLTPTPKVPTYDGKGGAVVLWSLP